MVAPALGGHKGGSLMSIAHDIPFDSTTLGHLPLPHVPQAADKKPLHRIADVRRRQGISVRSAARRMHTSIDQVRRQEEPSTDMLLSELLRWHEALDVPVADLLVESDAPLSEPIMTRARLLRIMKTVRAIKETATSSSIQRFATMLEQQLVELMPELKDVSAWHSIGQRRSPNELGRTAERVLPDSFFHDSLQ
jgi:transcriptional regulator with XRE-family HTH domain